MATTLIIIQLFIVLALIFIGARVGGIGLGIYGMVGVFILVFIFGLKPGNIPLDVMLIRPLCRLPADSTIWWDWLPNSSASIPTISLTTVRSPRGSSVS